MAPILQKISVMRLLMVYKKWFIPLFLLLLILPFGAAFADDDFEVSLTVESICDEVDLTVDASTGISPYSLSVIFGDEDEPLLLEVDEFPYSLSHSYPGQGEYEISVKVKDSNGLEGEVEQEIALVGPEVTLESDPFPPLLTLEGGQAAIKFMATVEGGTEPYSFDWDLDGDDTLDIQGSPSSSHDFTYSEPNDYKASVHVTDGCGFTESDTLKVVVLGDEVVEEEAEGKDGDNERACHPRAETIAEAVSSLDDGSGEYTCEDIFAIFRGGVSGDGGTTGFGRLWHAYQMALTIPELTWEDILDWKLEGSSWGALNQLNRFAQTIEGVGIVDLIKMVNSGDHSIGEIRTAMRLTLRYDANFEDALGRISDGLSKGEVGQFYKLAQDMEIDPAMLDDLLSGGASLSEVRHAEKLSDRTGTSLDEILTAHSDGNGWGEINQAFRLADEDISVGEILAMGVNEYRNLLREQGRLDKLTERDSRMSERDNRIANQFAERFGATSEDVFALFNGECEWKWACVRKLLRESDTEGIYNDRDARTMEKLANQYGLSIADVSAQLEACDGSWNCVRAHFRELAKSERGKN
jgi:hypothetical protein